MAAVTAAMVKELREMTGAGMMDCKKALANTDGDMDKAVEYLRENGMAKAAKKAGRIAAEGIVKTVVEGTKAAIVEVNSETDFVAKNAEFVTLARDIAMHVAAMGPKYISRDELDEVAIQKAREVFAAEIADKPAEMQEKIMEGKLAAYFKDQILLEQPFVKNPETTIAEMVNGAIQKFGENVTISKITRLSVK